MDMDMDDFLEDEEILEASEEEKSVLSLDDAVSALSNMISDACDFVESEMFTAWEEAEAFFAGESDVPKQTGRSQVTATKVRDAIRALKPNFMRIFVQSPEIVEYKPYSTTNFVAGEVAWQQTVYANQLFWNSGGYRGLLDGVHDALLKKNCVFKAWHCEETVPCYMKITNVTPEQMAVLEADQNLQILSSEVTNVLHQAGAAPIEVSKVEVVYTKVEGKTKFEHVPLTEFFVDELATCPEDAVVIGQRRNVTVSDARKLGLEYDGNWLDLEAWSVELTEDSSGSAFRRGYQATRSANDYEVDEASHKFLLTECYAKFDLDGTGFLQLYRFWLGGTDYLYLDHERVEEVPYCTSQIDPVPGAFFGRSVFDILREDQNTATSLLRATCDNAHLSNNTRLAVHETLVNMSDVMNPVLGAPIRVRAPGMLQEIGVSSSVGAMLPLLQYLQQNSDNKVGVTQASMGLDPDALQSTDKEAVKNTIMLAQGQVELMCRNFAETGLAKVFDKLLRLSIRHNPRQQIVQLNDKYVPVDQFMFDPSLVMHTKVGLGMPDLPTRIMGLQQVLAKQEQIIAQYGMTNPICSIDMAFNTIVDLMRLNGIENVGRYFNMVTPQIAQMLDKQMQQAKQQEKGTDPASAMVQAETIRGQARMAEAQMVNQLGQARLQLEAQNKQRDMQFDMVKEVADNDLTRDQMAQDLAVDVAKIAQTEVNTAYVRREQEKARTSPRGLS